MRLRLLRDWARSSVANFAPTAPRTSLHSRREQLLGSDGTCPMPERWCHTVVIIQPFFCCLK